jgi:myo-inositol 2-dehydrogenase/D-chiro-inositol 1-dehydrogenase
MQQLVIGIIGTGRIGRLHAENLVRNPRVAIKTVSDLYLDAVRDWAGNHGFRLTRDYRDIIRDPEIQAVFICSSTDTHIPIITEAAQAGKHIFCEKPISFDLEKTAQTHELVRRAGIKFQVGFNRRFDFNFARVRELVEQGRIGDPHIVRITSRDPAPPSYDYVKVSGGLFMDMAIHDFDMARFLSGSEVEEVFAQGAVLVDPVIGELGDIDTAVTTLKFKSGAIGVIDNSRRAVYGYDQRVEVFGSKGGVSVQNDFPNSAELSTGDGVYRDKPRYFFLDRYREAYVKETEAFVSAVLDGKDVPVSYHDGLQAERIAHAAKRSLLEKRPVRLDEIG